MGLETAACHRRVRLDAERVSPSWRGGGSLGLAPSVPTAVLTPIQAAWTTFGLVNDLENLVWHITVTQPGGFLDDSMAQDGLPVEPN